MDQTDYAIIGAGLSGLTCAHLLHAAGRQVVVIEAADRIGGRIHALQNPAGQAQADLGPTWVWPPYQPVVQHWLSHLDMQTFAQFNTGDAVIEGYHPTAQRAPLPGQDGMLRIAGGPSSLVAAMAAELPAQALHLNRRITGIADHADHLVLTDQQGNRLAAQQVVIAAPLRVAAMTIELPDAPATLTAAMQATPTWMAAQAKAVILYDRPFWREQGMSGRIASRTGPLTEVHDHTSYDGQAALFGFVGWPPDARDPDALHQAIRAQLVRCLGPDAARPLQIVVQDWAHDPLICTGADRDGAGTHPDIGPAILRQAHLGGRLRLAVSETSTRSPGLIEGALHAGQMTAQALLAL
jgi:monoamine oxidase